MDGYLQPYHGGAMPSPARPSVPVIHAGPTAAPHHHAGKTPGQYAKAVFRRIWVVLAVAIVVSLVGSYLVIRQKDVYQARAMISIESPQFDETLMGLLTHQVGRKGSESDTRYVANRLISLHSKELADKVVNDRTLDPPPAGLLDPTVELASVHVRQQPQSSRFEVTLDGPDPRRAAQLLNRLVHVFWQDLKDEHSDQIEALKRRSNERLHKMEDSKRDTDRRIFELVQKTQIYGPSGRNMLEERYAMLNSVLTQKRFRFDDLQHESRIAQLYPNWKSQGAQRTPDDDKLESLERLKEKLTKQRQYASRLIRKPNDPSFKHLSEEIADVNKAIAKVRAHQQPEAAQLDVHGMAIETAEQDIERLSQEVMALFSEIRDKSPEHELYLTMQRDRDQEAKAIADMKAKIADFSMLAESKTDPVKILQLAPEPITPVRPNRPLLIAAVIGLGLTLGVGLVCLTESFDRRIREPEPLTHGLSLPLLGVVPRIRRSAKIQRGGHLWTPGSPASIEADAFRNLRASLLGLHGPRDETVNTLLITSAKAGEGKSTTALNIAATCARSGERTLLMDVDLRRPSLQGVFEDTEGRGGLAAVLKGETPWQRTIVRTDLPNLDFLPTGDPRDVPVEILGSLELRQLLAAVSGQYDRVILDGPAVLGLADCRMLGRIVDAALLVVRSGEHELRPLLRTKAMLEQSKVMIAGVVLNGVVEEFKEWSSYGTPHYGYDFDGLPEPATAENEGLAVAGALA